jgi:hypothetical protein
VTEAVHADATSLSELARPLRMKALAKKLRARRPNDPKAQEIAKNLEWGAKYLQKKAACGTAELATLPVKEVFNGKTVWEGVAHVFDLEGHSRATRAYAWSSPVEGSSNRRFYAVLHLGGIRSPLDAVRAAIVAERRHG